MLTFAQYLTNKHLHERTKEIGAKNHAIELGISYQTFIIWVRHTDEILNSTSIPIYAHTMQSEQDPSTMSLYPVLQELGRQVVYNADGSIDTNYITIDKRIDLAAIEYEKLVAKHKEELEQTNFYKLIERKKKLLEREEYLSYNKDEAFTAKDYNAIQY